MSKGGIMKKILLFIILIILLAISVFMYIDRMTFIKKKIYKDLEKEAPIIFSMDFYTGEHGTFEYYPSNGT